MTSATQNETAERKEPDSQQLMQQQTKCTHKHVQKLQKILSLQLQIYDFIKSRKPVINFSKSKDNNRPVRIFFMF